MTDEELRTLLGSISLRLDNLTPERTPPVAVSLQEAARLLDCSTKRISRLIRRGELPVAMVGELRRVPMTELERLATPRHMAGPLTSTSRVRYDAAKASAELKRLRAQRREVGVLGSEPKL